MTSLLPEEESNVTRLKQKPQSHTTHSMGMKSCRIVTSGAQDESRSFLDFSRENLSISTSELEQGFSRPSRGSRTCCCSRQTLLSCAALLLALGCAALELWKLRRVLGNARDIEALRRDVESLKHRFLEKDLLDELKAFEEQLYGEATSEENDSNPSSNMNDYDSNYDESQVPSEATVTFAPNHLTSPINDGTTSSLSPRSATPTSTPCTSKDLEDVLAVLRRAEAERGQAFEQSVRERERLLEEEREKHRINGAEHGTARKRKRRAFSLFDRTRRRDLRT